MKYIHGGDIYSRKIDHDFSVNLNPLGMPEAVKKALVENAAEFEKYPDINCLTLKKAVSRHENISRENIVFGNGASDLIYRTVLFLKPKRALLIVPTFSEYEKTLKTVDCKTEYYYTDKENNFETGEDLFQKLHGKDIVFVCNPNNPTGMFMRSDILKRVKKICESENIYLFIDECFIDFAEYPEKFKSELTGDKIIILRAFTKIYAMAGLRLGYIVSGNEQIVRGIENTGQCWSVSVPSQIAGTAAIGERDYLKKTAKLISQERDYLMCELRGLGFRVYPSQVNFILFECGFDLDERLLKKKILIRSCENYEGLERGFFRIAVRSHDENVVLINTIREVKENG